MYTQHFLTTTLIFTHTLHSFLKWNVMERFFDLFFVKQSRGS